MQRGRFTYHLLRYLRGIATPNDPPITYASLMEEVSRILMPGTNSGSVSRGMPETSGPVVQQPHCEGRFKHRILFSTEEEPRVDSFPLVYMPVQPGRPREAEALYVVAGSMQGVTENTQFVYRYRFPDTIGFQTVAHIALGVVPNTIEADRSRLREIGTSGNSAPRISLEKSSIPEHAMVSVSTWGSAPMKVWCAPEVPLAVPALERARFDRAKYRDDADACFYQYDSVGLERKYVFERRDPLSLHFTCAKLVLPTPITEDSAILDAIARFNFHLYHQNRSLAVRQELQFDVRIHPIRPRDGGGLHPILEIAGGPESNLLANASPHHFRTDSDRYATYPMHGDGVKEAIITDLRSYYGLTVVNRSRFDLFVYVFCFDPADFSIADWYHPLSETQAPLSRDSELAIDYGTDVYESLMFTEGPSGAETAFVKIFVSNVYVDMSSVAQTSPLTEGGQRGMTKVAIPVLSGWNSAIYALTVVQSGNR